MLGNIIQQINCFIPSHGHQAHASFIEDIKKEILPYTAKVTICDRPTTNHAGLTQYNYDDNRDSIRKLRVSVAKQFQLSLSDAPFDRRFVIELAKEVEKISHMPGQCAEMSSISAVKLKNVAANMGVSVYTLQLPDFNHAITLLSATSYRSKDWVNWKEDFKSSSVIVDLWQGALSKEDPNALASFAQKNPYTKDSPRALVQCVIWDK